MATRNGRPRKPTDEARTEVIEIRMTASEKQTFKDAAQIAGISLSVWARERLRRVAIHELEDAQVQIAFLREESDATETTS